MEEKDKDVLLRLVDFNVYSENIHGDEDGLPQFMIQLFGINELGETYSIQVQDFKPFFYVLVSDKWNIAMKNELMLIMKKHVGKYFEPCIESADIVKRKKLYGFNQEKEYKFIKFTFSNQEALNKAKSMWYKKASSGEMRLIHGGYYMKSTDTHIILYESNIPPLLRFFHIQDISPSGWIKIERKRLTMRRGYTTCKYEYITTYKNIYPINEKETLVPYKICSFDIEASSSHGDFPIPVKSYKKLASNIIDYIDKMSQTEIDIKQLLIDCIRSLRKHRVNITI